MKGEAKTFSDTDPDYRPDSNSPEAEAAIDQLSWTAQILGRTLRRLGLGPPVVATPFEAQTILLVGFALTLNHYDMGLFALTIPRIQADLGITDGELGTISSWMRLGIFPALLIAFFADKIGRRLLLMITLAGAAACTLATAFASTKAEFVTFQVMMRAFSYAEDMLAIVVVAEVMHEKLRGWAIGALASLGALGHALSAIAYAQVDIIPYDWRGLYALGVLPMLFVLHMRRALDETERFKTQKAEQLQRVKQAGKSLRQALAPFIQLATAYPGRLIAIILAIFPFSFGMAGGMFFPKYMQDTHGFSPAEMLGALALPAVLAIAGNFLAGRLSDRYGRKKIVGFGFVGVTVCYAIMWTTDSVPLLLVMFLIGHFAFFAAEVVMTAMGSEIFPTSYRSTASGIRAVAGGLGVVLGLQAHSLIYSWTGDFGVTSAWLLVALPIGALAAVFLLPETASRTLEDIAPEVQRDKG